jgi:uncharacterized protein (DUF885 family)
MPPAPELQMRRPALALILASLALPATAARDADATLRALADRYVALELDRDPLQAYAYDLPLAHHDRFEELGARAVRRHADALDELRDGLDAIDTGRLQDPAARAAYHQLREALAARRALEVCKLPEWAPLNHMAGWHLGLADAAERQPVDSPTARREAVARWRGLPRHAELMTANLRRGLGDGHAVSRGVVRRVLAQLDGMLETQARDEIWLAPARHGRNARFAADFTRVVDADVLPALRAYRDFLRDDYLPQAPAERSLRRMPRGGECYAAFLRFHTTLAIAPEALLAQGRTEIARNEAGLAALAKDRFGGLGFDALVALPGTAPDNRFASEAEAVEFARSAVERAQHASAALFPRLPATECKVEPTPAHEQGSGRSSHYEPPAGARRHGVYRLNTDAWATDLRSTAEVTAVHETWPGHHLQMTWQQATPWPVSTLTETSAFIEGWGRYAEALGEEAGIYGNRYTPIAIRVWPARGLVTDIGIHWLGWSDEEAKRFLLATGRYTEASAEAALDRVAALPGQWTSYDAGAMEIRRLREEAQAALGPHFSLPDFHAALLAQGALPLSALREAMQAWIERERERR